MAADSLRERCCEVIEATLATLVATGGFQTFERWPDWENNTLDLTLGPALAMFDGSESADPELEVPNIDLVTMSFSVEIWTQTSNSRASAVELNRLRALVKRGLGNAPTLGGIAVDTRYLGCDDPEPLDLRSGASSGRMRLSFEVRRLEETYDA